MSVSELRAGSPHGLSHVLSHILSHISTVSYGMGQPLAPGARHATLWRLLYLLPSRYSSQPFLMQYIASFFLF